MPIPILQCVDCKYILKPYITEENFPGTSACEQYPEGAPEYVLEGAKDCPKFERR